MRHITFGRSYWFVVASALLTACGTIPATTAPTSAPVVAQPVAQTNAPVSARSAPQPPTNAPAASPTLLPAEEPPASAAEFKTDFSKHSVPYREILSGGPPKDGIPAIDHPKFVSVNEADSWLKPVEPAIFFQIGDDARAYPIQIFMWHEIVNDTVGGVPVVVTFCPLCNTAIAFERTVNGRVLDFGTTGRADTGRIHDRIPTHTVPEAIGALRRVAHAHGRQLAAGRVRGECAYPSCAGPNRRSPGLASNVCCCHCNHACAKRTAVASDSGAPDRAVYHDARRRDRCASGDQRHTCGDRHGCSYDLTLQYCRTRAAPIQPASPCGRTTRRTPGSRRPLTAASPTRPGSPPQSR
jgi:hypothetical protein